MRLLCPGSDSVRRDGLLAVLRMAYLPPTPKIPFRKAFLRGFFFFPLVLSVCWSSLGAAPPRVERVAVFPFENLRGNEKGRLLAASFQDALRRALLRSRKFALLDNDAANQWQAKDPLGDSGAPSPGRLEELRVDAAVHGSLHLVLELAVLKLRVTGSAGSLLKEEVATLRADLQSHPPEELVERLLAVVAPALGSSPAPTPLPEPGRWERLLEFHRVLQARATEGALDERIAKLDKLAREPALEGRVSAALAELKLERARLHSETAGGQRAGLEAALRDASHAAAIEPWNADTLALKGEILFFLKRYYEAKTEASVARLKNPLGGVAHVVLAMVAGLSTGAANEQMKAALLANPFLREERRTPGSAPFQGGVLEPYLARWDRLQGQAGRPGAEREDPDLRKGIEHFENQRWVKAARVLRRAADSDTYNHLPLLYLARIVIETGEPLDAAGHLRKLTTEFPEEPDIHFYLGIALEKGKAYPEAIRAFEKALSFRPDDELAEFHVGTAALANEEWDKASEIFGAVLDREADHPEAMLRFGIANARLKNWNTAEEALLRTLELNPGSSDAQQWLDWMRAERAK